MVLAVIGAGTVGVGSLSGQDEPLVVRQLEFHGNHAIDDQTLSSFIATTNSDWFARTPPFRWLGFLGAKRTFNERDFEADVERIKLVYRKSGYLDVGVDTAVRRTPDNVYITFRIREGPPTYVVALTITGLDTLPNARRLRRDLPLRVGDPFNRYLIQATADTIALRLQNAGYPTAEVFQSYDANRAERTATVGLDVYPGMRSVVGDVAVTGTEGIAPSVVRSLMTTRAGKSYSRQDLYRSQRNLYRSDLFRYVNVGIDSGRYGSAADTVPLMVRVIEGRSHRVRYSMGYGTDDCFRLGAGWTARNFLGNGRILDVSGRLTKIGIGEPTDFGLQDNLCQSLRDDQFSRKLNYNATVSIRRPAFLSPKNTAAISLFGERRSSPKVFQREEFGGSVSLARVTESQIGYDYIYRVAEGVTEADDVNFCAYFNACSPDDIVRLRQRRVLATLTARATIPRTNAAIDPTRGYIGQLEATVSSKLIGSSSFQEFVRFVGDFSWYQPLARGVVLSWRLRGGLMFAPQVALDSGSTAFIPPEQRFYAGGANDVRGYGRNELGPVVYVIDSASIVVDSSGAAPDSSFSAARVEATGGNTMTVGSVELRLPTGISSRLGMAFFVDAGSVWVRKESAAPFRLRITPGFGLRYATPLGPARLDLAYNPYDFPEGRLLLNRSDGQLVELRQDFSKSRRRGFTIHFSVGQAF